MHIPIITIDGPGGTGKGTVGKLLSERLNWHFLDSGVLYRVHAFSALKHQVDPLDEACLTELAQTLDVNFHSDTTDELARVQFEGQDVTEAIRTEECGTMASLVSAYPSVRQALLARQRAFAKPPGLVTDGRDMGTVVFPRADLKVFLTASAEERAARRLKQLKQRGIDANLGALVLELKARDQRDQTRAVSPLIPAPDALMIDTTFLSVAEVVKQIWTQVESQGLAAYGQGVV